MRAYQLVLLVSSGVAAGCAVDVDVDVGSVESAATFPTAWTAIPQGGIAIGDPTTDGSNGGREIVGDANAPAIFVATDATDFFVRFRLDDDPQQGIDNLRPFGWGLLVDTDGNLNAYEYAVFADGVTDQVRLMQNTTPGTLGDPSDVAETDLNVAAVDTDAGGNVAVSLAASTFGGTPDFFLDIAVPLHATLPSRGYYDVIASDQLVVFIGGTSNNGRSITVDLAGLTGLGTLTQAASDPVLPDGSTPPDTDGDGIPNSTDLDDDNDGIPDTREGTGDTDGDGVPDRLDLDSDNDGIPDVIEAGHDGADANHDGMIDGPYGANGLADSLETSPGVTTYPLLDTDGDGTPDFQDLDSDGDGTFDIVEAGAGALDTNGDGRVDGQVGADGDGIVDSADGDDGRFGFPSIDPRTLDGDGDGIPDAYDPETGLASDSDNDGIPDSLECIGGWVCPDTDNDGRPDYTEPAPTTDDDGDGILNAVDNCPNTANPGQENFDGDTMGDACDPDDDNDGALDAADSNDADPNVCSDTDSDTCDDCTGGMFDPATDGPDADGDGLCDPGDPGENPDSDGDGISDVDEGNGDTDGDGIPDRLDTDSDNDTISDADEAGDGDLSTPPVDTDNDGTPDFQDTDADGDGAPDRDEAGDGDLDTPPIDTDDDGAPDFQDLDADGFYDFIGVEGGGCNAGGSTSGAAALPVFLALFALAMRSRRRRRMLTVAATLAVTAGVASAQVEEHQGFSVERFRWTFARTGVLGAEWAGIPHHLSWDMGVWFGTANDPLVIHRTQNGEDMRLGSLVEQRTSASVVASIGLYDRIELGLEVPLVLSQSRSDMVGGVSGMLPSIAGVGLGDLRIAPKIGVLAVARHGVDVAVIPGFTLPTAGGESYRGEDGLTFSPEVAVSRASGAVRTSLNLGYRMRSETTVADLVIDDELFGEVAGGYGLGAIPLELDLGLSVATAAASPFGDANADHVEVRAGGSYDIPGPLVLSLIGGAGIREGFGTPDWRAVVGVRFGREKTSPLDPDGDGILGDADRCASQPEDKDAFQDDDGCPDPDNDADTIVDRDDRCAMEPETLNGFEDSDGCPDQGDLDGDGLVGDADKCPNDAEDRDGFSDDDGCPDTDDDADGLVDASDRCPREAGPTDNAGCPDADRDGDTIVDRLDNCPDEKGLAKFQGCAEKQLVVLTGDKLEILDIVYFALDKDLIQMRSNKLLNQVARVLAAHPEITKIQIEGHTDNQGDPVYNKDLSARRANAVAAYLVKKGIASDRLDAKGFGAEHPVEDNATKKGRAANRRVEFKIIGAPWVKVEATGPGADTMEK
jgi:uncharacterized protein (TIGR03382 family)